MSVVSEKLRAALMLMNNGGKHWGKGNYRALDDETGEYSYCSVGAVREVFIREGHLDDARRGLSDDCLVALNEQLPKKDQELFDQPWKNIVCWNDEKERTWDEVVDVFTRAAEASA